MAEGQNRRRYAWILYLKEVMMKSGDFWHDALKETSPQRYFDTTSLQDAVKHSPHYYSLALSLPSSSYILEHQKWSSWKRKGCRKWSPRDPIKWSQQASRKGARGQDICWYGCFFKHLSDSIFDIHSFTWLFVFDSSQSPTTKNRQHAIRSKS